MKCKQENSTKEMLEAIQRDFAHCAKGKSPCYFCAKDDVCECTNDADCEFVWAEHI